MRILMVASEVAPFAKTGGLADVLGALPAALVKLGEEVAVVMPRYRDAKIPASDRIASNLRVVFGAHAFTFGVDQVVEQGVRYLFVDCPPLYDRPGIYGFADEHVRYAAFDQAALAVARYIFRPHVFHVHDWQTGLLPVYLREVLSGDPNFLGAKCVLTIHNIGYQGRFWAVPVTDLGLPRSTYNPEGLEFFGDMNFLKGGIVWSDAITTVSPTYAKEIQTPEFGFGFDGLLRSRASKLTGILNGINPEEWNPAADSKIAHSYSAADLSGKLECKRRLLEEMGLPVELDRPLIGIVSRFATQKGFDLVGDAMALLADERFSMVVLGSGESQYEDLFRFLRSAHPDRYALAVGYNEGLAHRIEAGSDMFLMPSRYEPCGLNQMYSLRYGTVPIVRATGGLEDTVDEETGFKFTDYTPEALVGAIQDALMAYKMPLSWRTRMLKGMAKDLSWTASARAYQHLYGQVASF